MKLKGINPIEQNLEWIVLAIVGLVFVGVLAMQILLKPNMVTIGSQTLPPEQAFLPVEAKAKQVDAQLNASTVSLPEVEPVELATKFDKTITTAVVPRETIRPFGVSTRLEGERILKDTGEGAGRVVQLEAPAPATPMVAANRSTIDPFVVSSYEGLAEILPAEQPYDKASVTIQTTFDGTALRNALLADTGNARPLPPMWWNQSMGVLGLEVEREELGEDGAWTNATIVQRMPGMMDVDAELAQLRGFQDLQAYVEDLDSIAHEIERPSYYPVIAGPAWITPSESEAAASVELVRAEAERTLRLWEEARLEKEALEDELGEEPDPAVDRAAYRRWQQDRRPIQKLEQDMARWAAELEAIGVDPEVGLPEEPMHDPLAFEPEGQPLLSTEELHVWSHDMHVVPGATYRYRARVLLSNPAFGRAEALPEDQQDMASEPTMPTMWSEWSAPVEVPAETMYFLVNASAGETLGSEARATAEIFKFFYGYWRQGRVTLDPGDVIAKDLDLPEAELMPIYEVTDDGMRDQKADGPTSLMGAVDAFLLDVSQLPGQQRRGLGGGGRSQYEVYVRGTSGDVEVRIPEEQTGGHLYRRLKRSAEIGLRQGIPEPQEEAEPTRRPVRQPMEREIPQENPRRSGGGGGGGGG